MRSLLNWLWFSTQLYSRVQRGRANKIYIFKKIITLAVSYPAPVLFFSFCSSASASDYQCIVYSMVGVLFILFYRTFWSCTWVHMLLEINCTEIVTKHLSPPPFLPLCSWSWIKADSHTLLPPRSWASAPPVRKAFSPLSSCPFHCHCPFCTATIFNMKLAVHLHNAIDNLLQYVPKKLAGIIV